MPFSKIKDSGLKLPTVDEKVIRVKYNSLDSDFEMVEYWTVSSFPEGLFLRMIPNNSISGLVYSIVPVIKQSIEEDRTYAPAIRYYNNVFSVAESDSIYGQTIKTRGLIYPMTSGSIILKAISIFLLSSFALLIVEPLLSVIPGLLLLIISIFKKKGFESLMLYYVVKVKGKLPDTKYHNQWNSYAELVERTN